MKYITWQKITSAIIIMGLVMFLLPTSTYASFSYSISVTTNHTKVSTNDQSNFAVLATSTIATMKTVGNGGHVQNANGYDIYCYSDSALTTRIPCEREFYNPATGELIMWIKFSTLSHTADQTVYYGYGDASVSTDPNVDATYGKTAVWNSNYVGVWHTPDGTSLSGNDSTSNSNNMTAVGGPAAVTGQIDGAVNSNGAGYLTNSGVTGGSASTNTVTMSGWFKVTAVSTYNPIVNAGTARLGILLSGTSPFPLAWLWNNDGSDYAASTGLTISTGVWHYAVVVINPGSVNVYLDNNAPYTLTQAQNLKNINTAWSIAYDTTLNEFLGGAADEVRVSKINYSSDWITTEYNNQSNVGTFLTFGAETPIVTATQADAKTVLMGGQTVFLGGKSVLF